MRSSSGEQFVGLDHIRALAAFLVVSWHFSHGFKGYPVAFEGAPAIFPFALIDEGHVGVSLFMTLSGYLFARLLRGRRIDYRAFLINRALRLFPLLFVVILIVSLGQVARGHDALSLLALAAKGFFLPTWPNGGWSIAVEIQFYLIVPALLALTARSHWPAVAVIVAALWLRTVIFALAGEVQSGSYYYLVGRIDQFVLGMLAARMADWFAGRHGLAVCVFLAFATVYWVFDRAGGYYLLDGFPSPSPFWIILPTVEGAACGALIAWYDRSFAPARSGLSGYAARIGEHSYSIYLLHVFVIYEANRFVDVYVMDISNFYLSTAWSLLFFLLFAEVAKASFAIIEKPFLELRRPYILVRPPAHSSAATAEGAWMRTAS